MKKFLTILTIVALVLTTTVGCQPDEETPPGNGTEENQTPGGTETPGDTETPGNGNGNGGNGATLEDGTFNAESEPDDRGYKGQIEITVADGEITTVDYDEVSEDGVAKSEDEEYAKKYQASDGKTPAEIYDALQQDLIDKQDPTAVETISGATSSSEQFKTLAEEAMGTGAQ